jgi:hypothetical protein
VIPTTQRIVTFGALSPLVAKLSGDRTAHAGCCVLARQSALAEPTSHVLRSRSARLFPHRDRGQLPRSPGMSPGASSDTTARVQRRGRHSASVSCRSRPTSRQDGCTCGPVRYGPLYRRQRTPTPLHARQAFRDMLGDWSALACRGYQNQRTLCEARWLTRVPIAHSKLVPNIVLAHVRLFLKR